MKKRWIFRLPFAASLLSPQEGHKKPSGFNKNLLAYKLFVLVFPGVYTNKKSTPCGMPFKFIIVLIIVTDY